MKHRELLKLVGKKVVVAINPLDNMVGWVQAANSVESITIKDDKGFEWEGSLENIVKVY